MTPEELNEIRQRCENAIKNHLSWGFKHREFAEHAREDIPKLLAEVERLLREES